MNINKNRIYTDRIPYFSHFTKNLFCLILQIWQFMLFLDTLSYTVLYGPLWV